MGTLYIIPTPVGNMEDITLRALRILKEADLVLAEDTRTSGNLLRHYEISNHLMAHHKFNEHGTTSGIIERLKAGCRNDGQSAGGDEITAPCIAKNPGR